MGTLQFAAGFQEHLLKSHELLTWTLIDYSVVPNGFKH